MTQADDAALDLRKGQNLRDLIPSDAEGEHLLMQDRVPLDVGPLLGGSGRQSSNLDGCDLLLGISRTEAHQPERLA